MTDAQAPAHSAETIDSAELAFLTSNLPSFVHHIVRVSTARAYHELEHGAGVCKIGVLVTPERQRFAVFATRRFVLPGYHLVVRKDRLPALAPAIVKGEVDLDRLGALTGVMGAYTRLRHYDGAIPDFVAGHDGGLLSGVTANALLFNLIQAERIDYAFALPMDVFFYSDEQAREKLAILPIKGAGARAEGGVACSSDQSGRDAIRAIDAFLADDAHWAEFIEPYRKWVPPEDFATLLTGRPSNVDRVP